jgi:4-diphosphocytidyl-2-C-methyl-D-erythritol kinase
MIVFPVSKINLGLNVTGKRTDGFHNISSVFYPVNWTDGLEILEGEKKDDPFSLTCSGLPIDGELSENLIYKAWQRISAVKKLPPLKVHLHKHIPMGAGLGGGSSDAAAFINLADTKFSLQLGGDLKREIASELGSDCAFFIEGKAVMAQGRGNEFSPVKIDLGSYYILLVYPAVHSNTREAYTGIKPAEPAENVKELIERYSLKEWRGRLVNDFEETVFKKHPVIGEIKEKLYTAGALYASMSGSGSAVFGIFEKKPQVVLPSSFQFFLQKPRVRVL